MEGDRADCELQYEKKKKKKKNQPLRLSPAGRRSENLQQMKKCCLEKNDVNDSVLFQGDPSFSWKNKWVYLEQNFTLNQKMI